MMKHGVLHAIIRASAGITFIMAFLMSCNNKINEYKYATQLLKQKVNLNLEDSIICLTKKDAGIDFHGSWSETYKVTITENDLSNVINQISHDTLNRWITSDIGDYVTTLYPKDYRDTTFSFGIKKSESTIYINIKQGL